MADICTAIGSTIVTTLQVCLAAPSCTVPDSAGRSFCVETHQVPCGTSIVRWQCTKEDGSAYVYEEPFAPRVGIN